MVIGVDGEALAHPRDMLTEATDLIKNRPRPLRLLFKPAPRAKRSAGAPLVPKRRVAKQASASDAPPIRPTAESMDFAEFGLGFISGKTSAPASAADPISPPTGNFRATMESVDFAEFGLGFMSSRTPAPAPAEPSVGPLTVADPLTALMLSPFATGAASGVLAGARLLLSRPPLPPVSPLPGVPGVPEVPEVPEVPGVPEVLEVTEVTEAVDAVEGGKGANAAPPVGPAAVSASASASPDLPPADPTLGKLTANFNSVALTVIVLSSSPRDFDCRY